MKKIILIMSLLFIVSSKAQVNIGGVPYSFKNTLKQDKTIPIFTTNSIDLQSLEKEDLEDEKNNVPPRFGYKHVVNLDIENSGIWTELPNGDRIWQLEIHCNDAKSINLTFDKYWLPKNGKLYVFSKNKNHVIGGFSSMNNKSERETPRGFATGLVYSDVIILEYYHHKGDSLPLISINGIIHGYRFIPQFWKTNKTDDFEESGPCQVNVNCSEGDDWQDEKTGVAMYLVDGTRWCTGSLVNNTCNDGKLYFLTANHCVNNQNLGYGNNAPMVLDDFSFLWNYESPDCDNPTDEPELYFTNGASLVANHSNSDFALFLLDESPLDLNMSQGVMFNGWSRTNSPSSGGVGIHHPEGDIKKIATHTITPLDGAVNGSIPNSLKPNVWEINWSATSNGHSVTEGGSSGSPLFTADGFIIGQLYGGSSVNCSDPANDPGDYGKFNVSWNSFSTYTNNQLKHWLDPCNTDQTELKGGYLQECDMYKYVNYPINSFTRVEAGNTIYGSSTIANNTQSFFLAGEKIVLSNGFQAKASSDFLARIKDCESKVVAVAKKTEKKSSELTSNEIKQIDNAELMKIYPNPSNDIFNIEILVDNIDNVVLSLIDLAGRQYSIPHTFYKGTNRIQLNMKDFSKGSYIINFTNSDDTITKKILLK